MGGQAFDKQACLATLALQYVPASLCLHPLTTTRCPTHRCGEKANNTDNDRMCVTLSGTEAVNVTGRAGSNSVLCDSHSTALRGDTATVSLPSITCQHRSVGFTALLQVGALSMRLMLFLGFRQTLVLKSGREEAPQGSCAPVKVPLCDWSPLSPSHTGAADPGLYPC